MCTCSLTPGRISQGREGEKGDPKPRLAIGASALSRLRRSSSDWLAFPRSPATLGCGQGGHGRGPQLEFGAVSRRLPAPLHPSLPMSSVTRPAARRIAAAARPRAVPTPASLVARRAAVAARALATVAPSTNATYKLPVVRNEPNLHYAVNSAERAALKEALAELEAAAPFEVPAFVGGKEVCTPLCHTVEELLGLTASIRRFNSAVSARCSRCPTTTRRRSQPSQRRLRSSRPRRFSTLSQRRRSGSRCRSTTVPPSSFVCAFLPSQLCRSARTDSVFRHRLPTS